MDIFAHSLWSAAAAQGRNLTANGKKPVSPAWTAFWGIFPDLFAFFPMILWMVSGLILQTMDWNSMQKWHELEPSIASTIPIFALTYELYNLSHSLVIFGLVSLITTAVLKKPVFALGGWLLHILIDIPTHSARFFPTPFLWPLADIKVDGYSWSQGWFMVLNYIALIVVYVFLYRRRKGSKS